MTNPKPTVLVAVSAENEISMGMGGASHEELAAAPESVLMLLVGVVERDRAWGVRVVREWSVESADTTGWTAAEVDGAFVGSMTVAILEAEPSAPSSSDRSLAQLRAAAQQEN